MRYLPAVVGTLLILAVSCVPITTLTTPVVVATPLSGGDTMRLTWTAVVGATGYYVYLDGTKNTVTSGSYSYDITAPTKTIQVSAYDASSESDKWELTTPIVKTSTFVVYTMADAGQTNHAFYFTTDGAAVPIPLSQAANIDYVMDTTGSNVEMRSPNSYDPVYNNKKNMAVAATGTDFDQFKDALAPGNYSTVTQIQGSGLYSLFLDITGNGWSTDDHFGKLKVQSISGTAVTLDAGYQKIGGLRWLISQ